MSAIQLYKDFDIRSISNEMDKQLFVVEYILNNRRIIENYLKDSWRELL